VRSQAPAPLLASTAVMSSVNVDGSMSVCAAPAFASPVALRPSPSQQASGAASTYSTRCARRPRAPAPTRMATRQPEAGEDAGSSSSAQPSSVGGEVTSDNGKAPARPSFIQYIGRQIADRKAVDGRKSSPDLSSDSSVEDDGATSSRNGAANSSQAPSRNGAANSSQAPIPWFPGWTPKPRDPDTPPTAVAPEKRDRYEVLHAVPKGDASAPQNPELFDEKGDAPTEPTRKRDGKSMKGGFPNPLNSLLRARKIVSEANAGKDIERLAASKRFPPWAKKDLPHSASTTDSNADRGWFGRGVNKARSKTDSDKPALRKTVGMNPGTWLKSIFDVIIPNGASSNVTDVESKEVMDDDSELKPKDELGESRDLAKGVEELYKPPLKPAINADRRGQLFGNLVAKLPDFHAGAKKKKSTEAKEPTEGQAFAAKSRDDADDDDDVDDEEDEDTPKEEGEDKEPVSLETVNDATTKYSMNTRRGKKRGFVTAGRQLSSPPIEVSSVPQRDIAAIRLIFGSETFFATETLSPPGGLIFRGNLRGEPGTTLAKLEERLEARLGDKYTLCLAEGEEDLRPVVVIVPTARDKRPASPRQQLFCLSIFCLTVSTCFARALYANWQGAEFRTAFDMTSNVAMRAVPGGAFLFFARRLMLQFPVALMAAAIATVVAFSQIVQRYVARRHKTRIGLPFLLPSYQLGAFGAMVQLASPTPTRSALFDIALAGAGSLLTASVALLIVGLRLSIGGHPLMIPVPLSVFSSSMAIGWLGKVIAGGGQLPIHTASGMVGLHPLAVIGANCVTIAALNLLPTRQLDGGRIVSAIYGRKMALLSSRVTIMFVLLASAKHSYMFVFLVLLMFGPWNPDRPAKNELTEPNNARALVGFAFLLMMLAVLLPYPYHVPFKL
jgi:hypothetical protein